MKVSPNFPAPAVDVTPRRDPRPVALAQVGHTHETGTTYHRDVVANDAAADDLGRFASFTDGLRAASELARAEYRAGTTGHFSWKREARVDAIAILQASDGVRLVRTDTVLDAFHAREGYMFPRWERRSGNELGRAVDPSLLALVSHRSMLDLRGSAGNVVGVVPTPRTA